MYADVAVSRFGSATMRVVVLTPMSLQQVPLDDR
jgi:hypothetical protein